MTVHPQNPDYVLAPATRLLWRSPRSVQLESADGSTSHVVDGLPTAVVRRLAHAGSQPVSDTAHDPSVTTALAELARGGQLWPRAGSPSGPDPRRSVPHPRLSGELRSLATRVGERASEVVSARRRASVVVHGDGRAGPPLAALLATAGVGRVHSLATGTVRLHHALPGGVRTDDEGERIADATEAAIRRAVPDADTRPLAPGERPDVTVLAVDGPVDEARCAALHDARDAHLLVSVGAAHGVVGPLVVPGLTSCLRCAELHRRDRDPLWPMLAAQLSVPPRHGVSSDAAVTALVVAAAAVQVLAHLDGGDPACLDGSLELRLPDWRLRRRSRPPHAECGCTPGGPPTDSDP
ncbi:ThiF family adenylyltransferase [Jatrophihabitans fulvus]